MIVVHTVCDPCVFCLFILSVFLGIFDEVQQLAVMIFMHVSLEKTQPTCGLMQEVVYALCISLCMHTKGTG